MHIKLLALITALAVGSATGAVAFTSVRDTGPAPEEAPVSVPVAPGVKLRGDGTVADSRSRSSDDR